MKHPDFKPAPVMSARPGADASLKIPSLENGKRTKYKPPAAMCVGHNKIFTGNAK